MTNTSKDVKVSTGYVDGLGRPLQTVIRAGSGKTGNSPTDLVSAISYDQLGRSIYGYQPFAATTLNGKLKSNPFENFQSFMQGEFADQGETVFYSKAEFESSPSSRMLKTLPAGNNWAGSNRGVSTAYFLNTAADQVRFWEVSSIAGGFGSYSSSSVYGQGELNKLIMTDEAGNQVIEFKDKEGKVIEKRVQLTATQDNGGGSNGDGWIRSLYIYDYFGRLRCVVQPEGVKQLKASSWAFNSTILDEQSFRYEYDERGRVIMKKVPGAAAIYMVYDVRDRLVMHRTVNYVMGATGSLQNMMNITGLLKRVY